MGSFYAHEKNEDDLTTHCLLALKRLCSDRVLLTGRSALTDGLHPRRRAETCKRGCQQSIRLLKKTKYGLRQTGGGTEPTENVGTLGGRKEVFSRFRSNRMEKYYVHGGSARRRKAAQVNGLKGVEEDRSCLRRWTGTGAVFN